MSNRTFVLVGLVAVSLLGGAGATTYVLWPEVPERAVDQRTASLDVPAGSAKRRNVDGRKARSDAPRKATKNGQERPATAKKVRNPAKPDPLLAPEERAEAREEFREERLMDVNERLDAYATKAGWSAELTEEVRNVLIDTSDEISDQLLSVDRGEVSWEETRRTMRQSRLDQAKRVQELIGNDAFPAFVQGMEFGRFYGEEPVRGRLD